MNKTGNLDEMIFLQFFYTSSFSQITETFVLFLWLFLVLSLMNLKELQSKLFWGIIEFCEKWIQE